MAADKNDQLQIDGDYLEDAQVSIFKTCKKWRTNLNYLFDQAALATWPIKISTYVSIFEFLHVRWVRVFLSLAANKLVYYSNLLYKMTYFYATFL